MLHPKQASSPKLHDIPADLEQVLTAHDELTQKWNNLTPLSRNEWICWLMMVKKAETRAQHLERLQTEILEGKRRPCCWPGCPHRRESAKKWFR